MTLAVRHPGETMLVIAFFVLVASLFPMGVGAEPQLLQRIGPGVIWVCALLAAFLSLSTLFLADYADGSLEQMVLSPHPMAGWAAGKIAAHWVMSGLPLTVLSPFIGLQYGLAPDVLGFRGALCSASNRVGALDPTAVAAVRHAIPLHPSHAAPGVALKAAS